MFARSAPLLAASFFLAMPPVTAVPAFAQERAAATPLPSLTVRETWERQQRGELVLVDIRTPEEWAGGVAEGAVRLDMREPDFAQRLASLRTANPGKDVALICTTAGRTSDVQRALAAQGVRVVNVRGGMQGTFWQRGWRSEGLPVTRDPARAAR